MMLETRALLPAGTGRCRWRSTRRTRPLSFTTRAPPPPIAPPPEPPSPAPLDRSASRRLHGGTDWRSCFTAARTPPTLTLTSRFGFNVPGKTQAACSLHPARRPAKLAEALHVQAARRGGGAARVRCGGVARLDSFVRSRSCAHCTPSLPESSSPARSPCEAPRSPTPTRSARPSQLCRGVAPTAGKLRHVPCGLACVVHAADDRAHGVEADGGLLPRCATLLRRWWRSTCLRRRTLTSKLRRGSLPSEGTSVRNLTGSAWFHANSFLPLELRTRLRSEARTVGVWQPRTAPRVLDVAREARLLEDNSITCCATVSSSTYLLTYATAANDAGSSK